MIVKLKEFSLASVTVIFEVNYKLVSVLLFPHSSFVLRIANHRICVVGLFKIHWIFNIPLSYRWKLQKLLQFFFLFFKISFWNLCSIRCMAYNVPPMGAPGFIATKIEWRRKQTNEAAYAYAAAAIKCNCMENLLLTTVLLLPCHYWVDISIFIIFSFQYYVRWHIILLSVHTNVSFFVLVK